jgi:cytoskeletal protein RodZ
VYTRGLLRSYAKALGISESSVGRYYAKERPHEAKLPEPQLISQPLVEEPRYSNELILAAAGFALAAVLLVWLVKTEFSPLLTAARELLASGSAAPVATEQVSEVAGTPEGIIQSGPVSSPTARGGRATPASGGEVASAGGSSGAESPANGATRATTSELSSTATPAAPSPSPADATGTAAPGATGTVRPAPTASSGALRMTVAASGRVWLRVIADGEEIYSGFMQVGEQQSWRADQAVEIRTGNAGGTDVTLNGRRLAALGAEGVVLTCTWRLLQDGAIEQSC